MSLSVKVSTKNTIVNLSDLFTKNMYVASQDARQRNFATVEELKKRGFDLNSAVEQHQEITLSLAYEFNFNNKNEEINVQKYVWDSSGTKPHWAIK